MEIELIRPAQLTAEDIAVWRAIQASNPLLESPFFAPEFALAVARDDVFIARIANPPVFFAFHRSEDGKGQPVGMRLSDVHGLVACDTPPSCAPELLHACGLSEFSFRCIPATQSFFTPWQSSEIPTLRIDLSAPFGSPSLAKRIDNMRRRAEREIGPLRFTWHSADRAEMQALLDCKSAQYLRTGFADTTGEPWVASTLHRLHVGPLGVLSRLHAGEVLLATHFGIRSARLLHYWFPCYSRDFAKYSPGLMLLMAIARHAPPEGITAIDLGFAKTGYKERFANAGGAVYRGCITNL